MNKIQNGDFSSNFDHWNNSVGGGLAFSISAEQPFGWSNVRSVEIKTYKMCQEFESNDEIVTAVITAWASWEAVSLDTDGSNQFIVQLEKPDTTMVTLVNTTRTAVSSSGNILDGVDIKTHMATYGNYKLWLTLCTKSAQGSAEGKYYYEPSKGDYDNISIDVAVKKYKTVHEIIGSSGAILSEAKVSRSEAVGLVEAYSTETFSPSFNYETASESVGLSESYSKILKRIHGVVEVVGLSETIQAKRIQGNLETTYVLEDLTQWTEISRVETPWIKIKTKLA
jgi:hypothetical protein